MLDNVLLLFLQLCPLFTLKIKHDNANETSKLCPLRSINGVFMWWESEISCSYDSLSKLLIVLKLSE